MHVRRKNSKGSDRWNNYVPFLARLRSIHCQQHVRTIYHVCIHVLELCLLV